MLTGLIALTITHVATGEHRGGGDCALPNENCGNSLPPLPVALATVVQNDIFESLFHRKSNSLKIFTVVRETAFQKKL